MLLAPNLLTRRIAGRVQRRRLKSDFSDTVDNGQCYTEDNMKGTTFGSMTAVCDAPCGL